MGWCINNTTNSNNFRKFIFLLNKFVLKAIPFASRPVIITLDNAAIHLTKSVLRFAGMSGFEIVSLPPYSPHLAPWENIFAIVKRKLSTQNILPWLNFAKPTGKKVIFEALKEIGSQLGVRLWRKFIENTMASVLTWRTISKERSIIDNANRSGEMTT